MMEISDIHTHHSSVHAILNCFPEVFSPQPGQHYSVGIHPWNISTDYEKQYELLSQVASHPQVLAIGEAGLDKLIQTDMILQEKVFIKQAELAERLSKPLIIHAVRSFNELIQLKKLLHPSVPWIIHGFRNKRIVAEQLVGQGFYLSLGENYQKDILGSVPLGHIFLETDESRVDIRILYDRLAETLFITPSLLKEQIRQNIKEVFFRQ